MVNIFRFIPYFYSSKFSYFSYSPSSFPFFQISIFPNLHFSKFAFFPIYIYPKNDDSVKEAPAYCRSFLDGLYKTNGGGGVANPLFGCFTTFCKGSLHKKKTEIYWSFTNMGVPPPPFRRIGNFRFFPRLFSFFF